MLVVEPLDLHISRQATFFGNVIDWVGMSVPASAHPRFPISIWAGLMQQLVHVFESFLKLVVLLIFPVVDGSSYYKLH